MAAETFKEKIKDTNQKFERRDYYLYIKIIHAVSRSRKHSDETSSLILRLASYFIGYFWPNTCLSISSHQVCFDILFIL